MNNTIKVTVLVTRGKRILLIREWSKKRQGYFWNVIKGTYNWGKDQDLTSTAVREALEEVSLPISVDGLSSVFMLKRGEDTTVQFNFHCKVKGKATPKLRKKYEKDEDITEFRWFSQSDFQKLKTENLFNSRTREVVAGYFKNKKLMPLTMFKSSIE